jgi:hypothetical protein
MRSCVLCGFVCVGTRCTYKTQPEILFLTTKDQCGFVGHEFDPIKLQKLTMQKMMATSDAIDAGEPNVFMVGEAQTSHLLGTAKLLPAILTGSSYVDCVEFML